MNVRCQRNQVPEIAVVEEATNRFETAAGFFWLMATPQHTTHIFIIGYYCLTASANVVKGKERSHRSETIYLQQLRLSAADLNIINHPPDKYPAMHLPIILLSNHIVITHTLVTKATRGYIYNLSLHQTADRQPSFATNAARSYGLPEH